MANKKPSLLTVSSARKSFLFGEGGSRRLTDEAPRKAVFFDRDGTLNVDIHYLHRPEDFIWIPGAKEAIKYVNDKGYLAILVTNQSGVARGYYPESDVQRVYDWMNCELQKVGAHLDALYYCPHHPEGRIPAYAKVCTCRKPATGMIDRACAKYQIDRSKSYFVGDSDGDMECAARAGLTGIRYRSGSLLACVKGRL
ncbi:D-glycero-alpha-D-manno-heptose-1,7-bisphosphate 7-phosphatase [Selenomonas montiformis]|uniref:D-glycero-alpha-D-manno-heptose-1,7-bisphosphate 7-phosphatase n=1 Tax=Selenomonas montiformis TaxID=2652285 RepID=UPI0039F4AB4B